MSRISATFSLVKQYKEKFYICSWKICSNYWSQKEISNIRISFLQKIYIKAKTQSLEYLERNSCFFSWFLYHDIGKLVRCLRFLERKILNNISKIRNKMNLFDFFLIWCVDKLDSPLYTSNNVVYIIFRVFYSMNLCRSLLSLIHLFTLIGSRDKSDYADTYRSNNRFSHFQN
jgi:hypothetical protein